MATNKPGAFFVATARACSAAAKNARRWAWEGRSNGVRAASSYSDWRRSFCERSSSTTCFMLGRCKQNPDSCRSWFPVLRKERFPFFSGGGDWGADWTVRGGVRRSTGAFQCMSIRNRGPNRLSRCWGVGRGRSHASLTKTWRAAFTVLRSKPNTVEIHDALHVPPATHWAFL